MIDLVPTVFPDPAENFCMRLHACVCAQKIGRPDMSKGSLRPDVSFVQGLSGCTI